MRIVAGAARGRRIAVPATGTRPTSDRAREALFSSLQSLLDLDGASVLDLYAGSGALGLEALSRGAARVVSVESDPRAARVIAANVATVGLPGSQVVTDRAERAVAGLDPGAFDLLLADPPYALAADELAGVLTAALPSLRPGAVVVVERASRERVWAWPPGVCALRVRHYGAGSLWYGRRP